MKTRYSITITEKPYPNPHGVYNLDIWRRNQHGCRRFQLEVEQRCVDTLCRKVGAWDVEFVGQIEASGAFEVNR